MVSMLLIKNLKKNPSINIKNPSIENSDTFPAGIWCENDVVLTSMRRDYVASTLIRRHFDTKCPLGLVLPSGHKFILALVYVETRILAINFPNATWEGYRLISLMQPDRYVNRTKCQI